MLLEAALTLAVVAQAAVPAIPSAVDAFQQVCLASTTMKGMEDLATSQGWDKETYPADIRAGFLAEWRRRGGGSSRDFAEVYSKRVAEGRAYLIVSRSESLALLPTTTLCQLSIFHFRGRPPREALAAHLSRAPDRSWRGDQGNEIHDWFHSPKIQLGYALSKTPLAGPADLAGLSMSAEYSENR